MRFSLLTSTLGRSNELGRLLDSLLGQKHSDFELIVIDQNQDDRLAPILSRYRQNLEIRRLRSAPGLSRARNLGLQAITGDVICFPDDDCWYEPDVLSTVDQALTNHPEWDGMVGDSLDEAGRPTLPWRDREGNLTLPMSWRRSISYAIFLRAPVIQKIGGFNESLGVGAGSAWGSGEDNDLVLRALKAGCKVQYCPAVRVRHPRLYPTADEAGWKKRFSYAMGDGKLLQSHPMPAWWRLLFFSVPAGRALLSALRLNANQARSHYLTLAGRFQGYLSARNLETSSIPFPLRDHPIGPEFRAASAKARSAAGGS